MSRVLHIHVPCSEWLLITMNAASKSQHPGIIARPREAPGLSAGGLQVARRQVTLKPPTPTITAKHKKAPAC